VGPGVEGRHAEPGAKRQIIYNTEKGSPNFVVHHQPFNYFLRFAPGTPDRERHLKDYTELAPASIAANCRRSCSTSRRGASTSIRATPTCCRATSPRRAVAKIKASPLWARTRDHRHLRRERRLLGSRGAAEGRSLGAGHAHPGDHHLAVREKGYVDHTSYDTTSIIKFITRRFNLEPLPGVRAGRGRPDQRVRLRAVRFAGSDDQQPTPRHRKSSMPPASVATSTASSERACITGMHCRCGSCTG
jgi:hypothetical protein